MEILFLPTLSQPTRRSSFSGCNCRDHRKRHAENKLPLVLTLGLATASFAGADIGNRDAQAGKVSPNHLCRRWKPLAKSPDGFRLGGN
jgi:hypothetical protein